MAFFVIAHNGQKYGPADLPTLNQWASEGRVLPTTMLEDSVTGARGVAQGIPGLSFLPPPAVSNLSGPFPSGTPRVPYVRTGDGSRQVTQAWIFGSLCLVTIFLFRSLIIPPLILIPVIFGALGVGAASRAEELGHPDARRAKVFCIVALVLIFAIPVALAMALNLAS